MSLEKRAFYQGFVEVLLASGLPQSSTMRLIKQAFDTPPWLPYAAAGAGGAALGGLGMYGLNKLTGPPPVPEWLQQGQVQAPAAMDPAEFAGLSPYEQAYALGMTDMGGQGTDSSADDQAALLQYMQENGLGDQGAGLASY